MKKERKSLIFSIFINLTVSILKIIGGLFLGSYTLVTNGYYTLCDFSEEVLAFIGSLIGHKRAKLNWSQKSKQKTPFWLWQNRIYRPNTCRGNIHITSHIYLHKIIISRICSNKPYNYLCNFISYSNAISKF